MHRTPKEWQNDERAYFRPSADGAPATLFVSLAKPVGAGGDIDTDRIDDINGVKVGNGDEDGDDDGGTMAVDNERVIGPA
jgi:hypothetical protein